MKKLKKSEMLRRGQVLIASGLPQIVAVNCLCLVIVIDYFYIPCLGWTCKSREEPTCRSWQQLHCKALLFLSRRTLFISYNGVSSWWWYDDIAHAEGYTDWLWGQVLCWGDYPSNRVDS